MKKNKISFDTGFWASFATGNSFTVINTFFTFADLDYYKQTLTETVFFSYKTKVYGKENPSDVFVFYTALRYFIKVCYSLKKKNKKWKVKASLHSETIFDLSSLTKQEYENPFIVFQKAFNKKTPKEFELFLCQILELSLSPCPIDPVFDLTTPYVYLIKMLDAVALIRERGVGKIGKKDQIDFITE